MMTIERAIEIIKDCRNKHNLWCRQPQSEHHREIAEAYEIALKCMDICEIVDDKVYVEVLIDNDN